MPTPKILSVQALAVQTIITEVDLSLRKKNPMSKSSRKRLLKACKKLGLTEEEVSTILND